ncbi:hypothetical protein WJX72_009755 [[Myrmecia] bisecta]|uniref:Piwi domain-containing protein n=1 Tax=[Myrmecia] bisecta TaxID=41462 RepID=A0AAW1P949_9CHLO
MAAALGVQVVHAGVTKRIYRVKGLSEKGTADLIFENAQEGRQMSVAEYFEERYQIKLKYPNLPCLNVGSARKAIYLPPEVCEIVKGQRRLKLDEKQTAEMIKTAAMKPQDRVPQIERSVKELGKLTTDPTVKAFGMQVNDRLMEVDGRILKAPLLQYGDKVVNPGDPGDWHETQFVKSARLERYAIASFADQHRLGQSLFNWMAGLMDVVHECGMNPPQDIPEIIWHDPRAKFPGETMVEALEAAKATFPGGEAQIIFVCLPDNGVELYREVKRASDSFIGICSQCFVSRKAGVGEESRGVYQYRRNLMSSGGLKDVVKKLLISFYRSTRLNPAKLVFYRDGVSEGQFAEVQRAELPQIRAACMELPGENYTPPITFVVIQKRHHTRLFPTSPQQADRSGNVKPGLHWWAR